MITPRRSPAAKLPDPDPDAIGPQLAYMTTGSGGFWVARQRAPGVHGEKDGKPTYAPAAGHVLWLTRLQAQFDLARGAIVLMNPQPASRSDADVAKAVAAQGAVAPETPAIAD